MHAQHQQHPPQGRWGIGLRRGRHPHQLQRLPQVCQHHLPLGSGHRSGAGPNSLGLPKRQGRLLLLFTSLRAWLKGVQQGAAVAQPLGGVVAL